MLFILWNNLVIDAACCDLCRSAATCRFDQDEVNIKVEATWQVVNTVGVESTAQIALNISFSREPVVFIVRGRCLAGCVKELGSVAVNGVLIPANPVAPVNVKGCFLIPADGNLIVQTT